MVGEGQHGSSDGATRRTAMLLGVASLVPFAALLAVLFSTGGHSVWSAVVIDGFKTWSAVTLTFLGGIRWGLALRDSPSATAPFAVAALPAAVGWASLFTPDDVAIGVLLLAQCAQGAWDSISVQRGAAPAWFGNVRIVWTLLAVAAHITLFVAIY